MSEEPPAWVEIDAAGFRVRDERSGTEVLPGALLAIFLLFFSMWFPWQDNDANQLFCLVPCIFAMWAVAALMIVDGFSRTDLVLRADSVSKETRSFGRVYRSQLSLRGLKVTLPPRQLKNGPYELLLQGNDAGTESTITFYIPADKPERDRRWLADALTRAAREAEARAASTPEPEAPRDLHTLLQRGTERSPGE